VRSRKDWRTSPDQRPHITCVIDLNPPRSLTRAPIAAARYARFAL
jgi:hypothetical protein